MHCYHLNLWLIFTWYKSKKSAKSVVKVWVFSWAWASRLHYQPLSLLVFACLGEIDKLYETGKLSMQPKRKEKKDNYYNSEFIFSIPFVFRYPFSLLFNLPKLILTIGWWEHYFQHSILSFVIKMKLKEKVLLDRLLIYIRY